MTHKTLKDYRKRDFAEEIVSWMFKAIIFMVLAGSVVSAFEVISSFTR